MYVNVSDVAAFIGQVKWDITSRFETFWKNNDLGFGDTLEAASPEDADAGLTSRQVVEKYVGPKATEAVLADETIEHVAKVKRITELIQESGATVKPQVVTSLVNTSHGIKNEEKVVQIVAETKKKHIDRSNKLYKKQIIPRWTLCGRIDGLCDDHIIEVKNRVKGFFNTVRDYENTQVQLYMWMVDVEYTDLEEHYNGETRTTRVHRDDDYIEDVVERLGNFCKKFEVFLADVDRQHAYLRSSAFDKAIIVRGLQQ